MMYTLSGALEPIFINPPKRSAKLQRSANELRCAAAMLEKLRRREDQLPPIDDADRVMEVVVDRILREAQPSRMI